MMLIASSRIPRAAGLCLALLLSGCAGTPPTVAAPTSALSAPSVPTAAATIAAPAPAKLLTVAPEKGVTGTPITISGEGLPAGKPVDLMWATVDGSYDMKPTSETIEYYDRRFKEKRVPLSRATVDAAGKLAATVQIPEDYGDVHDIYAVIEGQDVARGGFSVTRNVTVSALNGPVGAPITIKVTGLGWGAFTNTIGVMWDASYTGFISAVTTRGTAEGRIRAAGPIGTHVLRITDASGAVPYLNTEQSPRKLPQFRFDFRVTSDPGPAAATLEWPDPSKVATTPMGPITTASAERAGLPGVTAKLSPSTGPILTKTTLAVTGLGAGSGVDLIWMTVKGNRASGSGWNLVEMPLAEATAGSDGSLSASVQVPDDLGGWHVLKLASGGKVLAETPFFIERSFVDIAPAKVKAGDTFTVHTKGLGWTELDNGYAVVYDDHYLGYGCGFNSQGDLTMNLVATGAKGTHILDLYPMVFNAHGKAPWDYYVPWLASGQDHPSLLMGYRVPIYRIAFEIVD